MSGSTPKILFVTNDAWFFESHRLPIAVRVIADGMEAVVVAHGDESVSRISAAGCKFVHWNLSPRGRSLLSDARAFFQLMSIIKREKPTIVHLVTIKPVLYGGLISRLLSVPGCVYAISGLGAIFSNQGTVESMLRRVIMPLYKMATNHQNSELIFQNKHNQDTFKQFIGNPDRSSTLIKGSGVDLSEYRYVSEPTGVPVVTLAARLLKDKGIQEFADAASILLNRGVDAKFQIAGGNLGQGNPAAFNQQEITSFQTNPAIAMLGHRKDISTLFEGSNLVVLPSYHEGLPKVLVEAGACGRAVVTSDVPGCRDAILPDESGLLVPVGDANALADAIQSLLLDDNRRKAMGKRGRELVENTMQIESVVEQHMGVYRKLLRTCGR